VLNAIMPCVVIVHGEAMITYSNCSRHNYTRTELAVLAQSARLAYHEEHEILEAERIPEVGYSKPGG